MSTCPVSMDLNRYMADLDLADRNYEAALAEQEAAGIDAVEAYAEDVMQNRDYCEVIGDRIAESGKLGELLYLLSIGHDEGLHMARDLFKAMATQEAKDLAYDADGLYAQGQIARDSDPDTAVTELHNLLKTLK